MPLNVYGDTRFQKRTDLSTLAAHVKDLIDPYRLGVW